MMVFEDKNSFKKQLLRLLSCLCLITLLAEATACTTSGGDEQSETSNPVTADITSGTIASSGTETEAPADTELLITPGELFISDELTPGLAVNKTMQSLLYLASPDNYTVDDVQIKIKAEEHGVKMNDPAAADTNLAAINAMIAGAEPGTAILFPEGKLYVAPTSMGGIAVYAKKDLVLHGENTLIVDTSYAPQATESEAYARSNIFVVYFSERITIEGFGIEYLGQTSADGRIAGIAGGYTYIEMSSEAFSADIPVEKQPISGGEVCYCLTQYDDNGVSGVEYYLSKKPAVKLEKAEAASGITGDAGRLYKIKGTYGKTGDLVACRFSSGTYSASSMTFYQSTGLILRDITIRSAPAQIAHFGLGCADIWVDRLSVKAWDGIKRYFTTNIDTLYFSGVRGRIEITDCDFEGLGDDAVNVHSRLMAVSSATGSTVSITDFSGNSSFDAAWVSTGDTLRFFKGDCSVLGDAKVTAVEGNKITVDKLPDGVGSGCTVQNREFNPVTRILRCRVSRGRARAFLIQTANALIDDCDISLTRLAGIIISPDFDKWFEAGFTDNVLIRNCTFTDCCGYAGSGVITVSGCHDGNAIPADGITGHKNITVLGCSLVFNTGHRKASSTSVRACDNLAAVDN